MKRILQVGLKLFYLMIRALWTSTKILYVEPYWNGWLFAHIPSSRPTQPPTLSGMGNEPQPKCGDARRLRVQTDIARSIYEPNVCVADKTIWSCHVPHLQYLYYWFACCYNAGRSIFSMSTWSHDLLQRTVVCSNGSSWAALLLVLKQKS